MMTIIIMLILAGVSINAIVGDDGIITKAQDTKFIQSLATLQETVNFDYVNNFEEDKNSTLEAYIRKGYVTRILTSGLNNTIDIKYIFIKENLPETWKENLVGGNGIAAQMKDIYGLNSNLECWYIGSDGESIIGNPENLVLNENEHIEFADDGFRNSVVNMVGKTSDEITVSDIQDITTLTLRDDEKLKNLDDLYYFPNLKSLTLDNLHLDNVNGIIYSQNIEQIIVRNSTTINNWQGFCGLTKCTIFDIHNNAITQESLDKIVPVLGGMPALESLYVRSDTGNPYVNTFTNIDCFDEMANKNNIHTIYLDGSIYVTSIEGIKNFSDLERLDFISAQSLEDISVLYNFPNMWRIQLTKSKVKDFSKLSMFTNLKQLDLQGNSFLTDLSFMKNLTLLEYVDVQLSGELDVSKLYEIKSIYNNATTFYINEKYKIYFIDNNATDVNLNSNSLDNLSILNQYPNANIVRLDGNNLTNASMEYFKENNNSKITALYLRNNNITNLDWLLNDDGTLTLPNLKTISLYNNDNLEDIKAVQYYNLVNFDVGQCNLIKSSTLYNGTTYYLPSSIVNLYFYGCSNLTDLNGIVHLVNLEMLNIAYTGIYGNNAVALNSLNKLGYLILGNNGNNIDMTTIIPTINKINRYLAIEGNHAAELAQQCNNINVTNLRFDYSTSQYSVGLNLDNSYYYADRLDFSSCEGLTYFRLWNRYVKNVVLPTTDTLKYLYLKQMYQGLHFSVPDLTCYTNLEVLEVDYNYLTKDDFSKICVQLNGKLNLTSIKANNNSISKIDNINRLGSEESTSKDLVVDLSNNIINDLTGIENMKNNIVELNLSNNKIEDVSPLINLGINNASKRLNKITLTGNTGISEEDINTLRQYYTIIY